MFKIHGCYWYLSKWLLSVELSIFRFRHNFGHRVELGRGSQHKMNIFRDSSAILDIALSLWEARNTCEYFRLQTQKKAFSNSLYICVVVQVDGGIVLLCRSPRLHCHTCYSRTSSKSGSCAHLVVCASRVHEYSVIRPEVTVSESKSWWCCLRIPLEAQTQIRIYYSKWDKTFRFYAIFWSFFAC